MNAFFPRSFLVDRPVVDSARGVFIKDRDGREYLDGCSGAIVSNLGHGVPEIETAINAQLARVAFAHTSQFWSEPALELAAMLIEMAPAGFRPDGRAYLTSGGSESVETSIKLARSYFVETGEPDRHILVSRRQSYHGSTTGALSATGHPARRAPYLPILKTPHHIAPVYKYRCPCGDSPCQNEKCDIAAADDLEKAIHTLGRKNVMAFIAEPIAGAALGAAVPGEAYWKRIREICTTHGILLIVDEVMVGLGRTGSDFAIEQFGVEPDIIVLGKGLAAGYQPLGAVLASSRIIEAIKNGSGFFEHGFTYNGHPVAAAAGRAALSLLKQKDLSAAVRSREKELFATLSFLKDCPIVGDIRGRGFLAGIELVRDRDTKEPFDASVKLARRLASQAEKAGLLVYPGSGFLEGGGGDHIMIAPPFTISTSELQELGRRLKTAFDAIACQT
ncbi:MAG: aspartate aminotransferase family protein [Candidatus Melainabacteria bacterium]|nr:aspartate aminotransferase family protein [Candidatus Melainabacteria bacterium]